MIGRAPILPLALLTLLSGSLLLALPTRAAVTFVQARSTGTNGSSLSQLSTTFSSAQQAGNLIVVMVSLRNGGPTAGSVTDSKGNTYVLAVGPTYLEGFGSHAIYYAKNIVAAAAGTNTVTLQFGDAVPRPTLRVAEYSGVDTTNPFLGGVGATGTTGVTLDSGPLTTSYADVLLVAGDCAEWVTNAAGAGYTLRTSFLGRILEDRIVTSTGTYNANATQSTSGRWVMQLAAFKAAGGGGGDTQAPTTPTNLSATAVSSTQINLSWNASTDNVAVTGYLVERCQGAGCSNFAQIATPTTTSYNDTGRSPSTSYSYRVRAQDAVPNYSTYSTIASATTSGAGDTEAPTAPSGLTAGAISSSQVNLSWTASTDNVGVTGYRVERCTGTSCSDFSQIGPPATTSYSDTGLSASTSYRYRVRAADAADNLSGYSGVVAVTTHANSGPSTITYTYDAAGRLIRAVSSSGRTIEYEYDANGNITVIERQ